MLAWEFIYELRNNHEQGPTLTGTYIQNPYINSPLVGSTLPYKYSYEIGRSFADPLTVHSLYPSIKSSHTKKVVFALYFSLKLSCESSLLNQCILVANPF